MGEKEVLHNIACPFEEDDLGGWLVSLYLHAYLAVCLVRSVHAITVTQTVVIPVSLLIVKGRLMLFLLNMHETMGLYNSSSITNQVKEPASFLLILRYAQLTN